MSDHADTIRRALAASNRATELHYRIPDLTIEEQQDALALMRGLSADVNDLVAEIQRLRDALERIAAIRAKSDGTTRKFAAEEWSQAAEIARAALAAVRVEDE